MEQSKETDRLIAAYLHSYRTGRCEDAWAEDEIARLVRTRPAMAWPIVRQLVHDAPDDSTRFYVAAGPLEDIVKEFGNELWNEIECEARQNRRFLEALSGIYLDISYGSIYERWRKLMERYRLIVPIFSVICLGNLVFILSKL